MNAKRTQAANRTGLQNRRSPARRRHSGIVAAHALSQSGIADQEYTFLLHEDLKDWLIPHAFGPCQIVGIPRSASPPLKRLLRSVPGLRTLRKKLPRKAAEVPVSDGFVENHGFDVVHFPTQIGYLTALPTIYQPWDLQHLHHPEFFSASDILTREKHYRALCGQAKRICVQTQWSKNDLVHQYKIDPEKIAIVPWGRCCRRTSSAQEAVQATIEKFGLPDRFFFYPAATWPHKNHALICRALQAMKSGHGRIVHVYCTGMETPYRKELGSLAQRLGVEDQIHFLGFVTPDELQAIYRTATAMIFPSRFEGFGLPILEAFSARLPVLCARATVLPEVAREAALYLAPILPRSLWRACERCWSTGGFARIRLAKENRFWDGILCKTLHKIFKDSMRRLVFCQEMIRRSVPAGQ